MKLEGWAAGTVSLARGSVWLCRDLLEGRHHLDEDQLRSTGLVQENILRTCRIYLNLILHDGLLWRVLGEGVSSPADLEMWQGCPCSCVPVAFEGQCQYVPFCPRFRRE